MVKRLYKCIQMEGDPDFRAWNELIPDALGIIFSNLNGQEVVQVLPLVCKSWCKVVEGPYCWRRIDTNDFDRGVWMTMEDKVEKVLRTLIPRSSGSLLRELRASWIDDRLLSFVAQHAGSLETLDLEISRLSETVFEQFAAKLSSLTTLVIRSNNGIEQSKLDAISQNCKRLVSLSWEDDNENLKLLEKLTDNEDKSLMCIMPNLKHLSIRGFLLRNSFVLGLLSCCPNLECVEIQGGWCLSRGTSVVKEKYPDIVSLDLRKRALPDGESISREAMRRICQRKEAALKFIERLESLV